MPDEILIPDPTVNITAWARGGAAGLAGIFLGVLISIALQFVLAHVLGAAGLGSIGLASALFLVLVALVPLGLDSSAMRYVSFHYARKELAQTLSVIRFTALGSLLLAMIVTPLVIGQSDWIALRLFGKPEVSPVLRILLLGLPFAVLLQVLGSILQGFEKIGTRMLAQQILVPLFRLTGVIVIFLLVRSVSTTRVAAITAIAYGLGALVVVVIVYRQSRRLGIHTPVSAGGRDGLYRYSGRAFVNSAIEQLNAGSPVFLLGILSSSSQVGIFGAAFRAALVLGLVLTSLNFIASPAMSSLFATGSISALQALYSLITRWAVTLGLPVFSVIIMLAPSIMGAFGREFKDGTVALQLIALGQMVCVASGPCRTLLNVTDHQRLDVINGVIGLLVGVGISCLLIPRFGASGAALGAAAYLAVVNLLGLIQARRVLRMQPYSRLLMKPLASGLMAAAIAFGIERLLATAADWIRLCIVAAALPVVYCVILLALGLEPQDRIGLRNLFRQSR